MKKLMLPITTAKQASELLSLFPEWPKGTPGIDASLLAMTVAAQEPFDPPMKLHPHTIRLLEEIHLGSLDKQVTPGTKSLINPPPV